MSPPVERVERARIEGEALSLEQIDRVDDHQIVLESGVEEVEVRPLLVGAASFGTELVDEAAGELEGWQVESNLEVSPCIAAQDVRIASERHP